MTIHAIYENGVFRPTEPVNIAEKTEVEVIVPAAGEDENQSADIRDIDAKLSERASGYGGAAQRAPAMREVFLDTVGLLALWDQDDQWHEVALRAMRELGKRARTVTTTSVMLECGNAASRRAYRNEVDSAREEFEAGGKLIIPDDRDWLDAWAAYRAAGIGGAGIVDQISFVVMRRLGITDAFTNDRHFRVAGFNTLF